MLHDQPKGKLKYVRRKGDTLRGLSAFSKTDGIFYSATVSYSIGKVCQWLTVWDFTFFLMLWIILNSTIYADRAGVI